MVKEAAFNAELYLYLFWGCLDQLSILPKFLFFLLFVFLHLATSLVVSVQ